MKTEPIRPYKEKTGLWPALLVTLLFYAAVAALITCLAGCAGTEYIFRGAIATPYGSATSDGKTVTVTPTSPGVVTPIQLDK